MAGGNSAKAFDYSCLRGKRVLAVNDSVFMISTLQVALLAVAVFSADAHWAIRHCDFLNGFRGEKYLAVPLETWPACDGIPGATYLRRCYREGLNLNLETPSVCTGGNSGYAAINLAVLKGAKEIHLVGYDMDPAEGDKYRQWIPRFRTMLPQLRLCGVQVWNHNRDSYIDAFQKI